MNDTINARLQCLRPGSAPEDEATTSADLSKMVNGLNARYAREGGERYPLYLFPFLPTYLPTYLPTCLPTYLPTFPAFFFCLTFNILSPLQFLTLVMQFGIYTILTKDFNQSVIFCQFPLFHRFNNNSLPCADGTCAPHVLVDYEEVTSLSLSQRVALWLAADVFLLTTVREGLNLYPLEYICARRQLGTVKVN